MDRRHNKSKIKRENQKRKEKKLRILKQIEVSRQSKPAFFSIYFADFSLKTAVILLIVFISFNGAEIRQVEASDPALLSDVVETPIKTDAPVKNILKSSNVAKTVVLNIIEPSALNNAFGTEMIEQLASLADQAVGDTIALDEEKEPSQKPVLSKEALELKNSILPIVQGTPMEAMIDDIATKDRRVAAFLVGIAMKESKYGIYSPKKNGEECYNYWGYRGKENTTLSGYSCFDSPSHAVSVVGNRIARLVDQGAATPSQMIVWKCGSTCAGHSPESVSKWISDVSINYYKLIRSKEIAKNN